MAPQYKLVIKNRAGVKQAEVVDFIDLEYYKRVNAPGALKFRLRGAHTAINSLALDGQVEVWRRDITQGISWYADFYSLFRGYQYNYAGPKEYFTAGCPGQMSLLGRRIVAWYANTTDRTKFTSKPAETVLKTLVNYNACSSATVVNGRKRDGALTGLSIQTDGATGNTISWTCAWKPLLPELQSVALVAGGDFDLVKTGAQTWEFRWYAGQLGTDRSTTVTFATDYGNMVDPLFRYDQSDESTVAIVGGAGEDSARAVVSRSSSNYSATDNDTEMFVDGKNDGTDTNLLNSRGDSALNKTRAKQEFSYKVRQTPASLYGEHYFLGDLVTARYRTVEVTQQVYEVTVRMPQSGQEQIEVRMRDLDPTLGGG